MIIIVKVVLLNGSIVNFLNAFLVEVFACYIHNNEDYVCKLGIKGY